MKLGHTNDEIKYLDTKGETARYIVILDGEPTMQIICNAGDPEKVIHIARAGAAGAQATAGRFTMTEAITEDSEGMPLGVEKRVNEKSVYTYVIPRLHVLLGRLLREAA